MIDIKASIGWVSRSWVTDVLRKNENKKMEVILGIGNKVCLSETQTKRKDCSFKVKGNFLSSLAVGPVF